VSVDTDRKIVDLLRSIEANKEVGPGPVDDALAQREAKRYADESVSGDDPSLPARKARDLRLADLQDYYTQRRKYIPVLFKFMVAWVVGLLALLVLSAFQPPFTGLDEFEGWDLIWVAGRSVNWVFSFQLSDAVLMALVGGTTANVIGLFVVVARYLYPSDKTPDPHGF